MPYRPPQPPPSRDDVLRAALSLPGRPGVVGGRTAALPGPSTTDIARALHTESGNITTHLVALVAAGALVVRQVGPFRCYMPPAQPERRAS